MNRLILAAAIFLTGIFFGSVWLGELVKPAQAMYEGKTKLERALDANKK